LKLTAVRSSLSARRWADLIAQWVRALGLRPRVRPQGRLLLV